MHVHLNCVYMQPFKCKECLFSSDRKYNLDQHKKSEKHKNRRHPDEEAEFKENSFEEPDPQTDRVLEVDERVGNVNLEESSTTAKNPRIDGSTAKKARIDKNTHSAVFNCRKCPYSTSANHNFQRHQKTHTMKADWDPDLPFKCEECLFSSDRKYNLDQHKKSEKHKNRRHPDEEAEFKENSFEEPDPQT
eukprot:Platyproteum_vivax@DN7514_c0_g1_i1.p1